MDLNWYVDGTSVGTYSITERNRPDFPIKDQSMDGGDYLRAQTGALYNPSRYRYGVFTFTFTTVKPVIVDTLGSIFESADYFTIADDDFGTGTYLPVPGTLSADYITRDNCNVTFVIEDKEATT